MRKCETCVYYKKYQRSLIRYCYLEPHPVEISEDRPTCYYYDDGTAKAEKNKEAR